MARITVALAGNPNSGKSTLFNALTGARQHVGNYPGVTVEKKYGVARHGEDVLRVVDLPGTYSLAAYSAEEIAARNYLLDESPDVVIDVVDSSNLERNLYLAVQLLELGVPLVLAFNMTDVARSRGYSIDNARLSRLLGVPIVATVAHKRSGVRELLDAAVAVARQETPTDSRVQVDYGSEIEPHVEQLTAQIAGACAGERRPRWRALKLLENDAETARRLRRRYPDACEAIVAAAERIRQHIRHVCGDAPEAVLADRRYGFISGACTKAVRLTVEARHERSDRIDAVMTSRWLGLPLFAVMMYLMFQFVFALGNPLVGVLEAGQAWLVQVIGGLWAQPTLLQSLVVDGVIEGVGTVVVFVPLVALLYLAIALLEDSGYMARAAFVLDRLMTRAGLGGKSFIPMLIGFGCTVPAVLATRTIHNRRDRLITILVLPLMSCGARLPIYVLILGAFFPPRTVFRLFGVWDVTNQALLLSGLYAAGVVAGVVSAKLIRATVLRGEAEPFVMELPPYRLPTLKGLLLHTWERTWLYLRKAGTIILGIAILLWALATWPRLDAGAVRRFEQRRATVRELSGLPDAERSDRLAAIERQQRQAALRASAIGHIGRTLAPVLAPCGFDWKISTALVAAAAAKEVFVSQLGVLYSLGEADARSESLRDALTDAYTPLQGLCVMLFCLLCMPCVATVAVVIREASWRWALLQIVYLTALAWLVAAAVYQTGRLLGFGAPA